MRVLIRYLHVVRETGSMGGRRQESCSFGRVICELVTNCPNMDGGPQGDTESRMLGHSSADELAIFDGAKLARLWSGGEDGLQAGQCESETIKI
jgi:hypothetical protein